MDKTNGKEKPQGMSVTKARATAKTRRDKQAPEIEVWKDIPQTLSPYSFSEHFMFETVLRFKTE